MKVKHLLPTIVVAFICGFCLFLVFLIIKEKRASVDSSEKSGQKPGTSEQTAEERLRKDDAKSKTPLVSRSDKKKMSGSRISPEPPVAEPVPSFPPVYEDEAFSSEDLDDNRSQSIVYMDIGNYDVTVGNPVTVSVRATAPALANFSLMMSYDPDYLEYIDDSVETVGDSFRNGIEFYARNDQGELIVISSGNPGAKHIAKVRDETVVTFQMHAKKAGTTEIASVPKGIICLDPFGEKKEFDIRGGEVRIWEK